MTDDALRLKILLAIPALSCGGAECVLVRLARGFVERGHRVTVATLYGRDRDFYRLPQGVERMALDVSRDTSRLRDKLKDNWHRIRALRAVLRQVAPDVVVSFLTQTNVLAILAARGLHIPVIVSEHTDPRREPVERPWRALRRLTYRFAARLVSVSAGVDAWFSWLSASRRAVIDNPIEIDALEDSRSRSSPFPWPHTLVSMGRLSAEKGFDVLLSAFARLTPRFADWGLVIFGEGPLRAALEAQIDALKLTARVKLPGTIEAPAAALRQADLFALPSRYEGFGLAMVEAMACGLPVVATRLPAGPAQIIRDGVDGLLVPAEDPEALACALGDLMGDPARRENLGRQAAEAARRFDLPRVIEAWQSLLEQVVAGRR